MKYAFVFLILPFIRFKENWFRARVMAVDRKSDKVAVFLIDYGPTEIVEKVFIRRNIIYQNTPVMTFNGNLHSSITLLTEKDISDWSEETLDRIHKFMINRICTISVKSFSPLQVSLKCNLDLEVG